MLDYNGPEIGEADDVLMEALQLHFKDNPKGIHFDTHNVFRSNGLTVQNILSKKVDVIDWFIISGWWLILRLAVVTLSCYYLAVAT